MVVRGSGVAGARPEAEVLRLPGVNGRLSLVIRGERLEMILRWQMMKASILALSRPAKQLADSSVVEASSQLL